MTETQKKRSIAALKANETRKLAKLSTRAWKARKAIQEEYAKKIGEIERCNSVHTTKVSCSSKKSCKCMRETKTQRVYEIYTCNNGRFVFLGKTTKNPLA